jgi:hypothetical protein
MRGGNRTALFLILVIGIHGSGWAADYRIRVPDGMQAVTKQVGDTIEISFLPAQRGAVPRGAVVHKTTGKPRLEAASSGSNPVVKDLQTPGASLRKGMSSINFDRPLSAAPAFVALDETPETVNNPSTPREFAASLLNGVDGKGVLQTGLAVDVAPYQLFFGPQTSLRDYRDSYFTRLLYNTNFSLGTTKAATGSDKAQRLALGVSVNLFDKGDPRLSPVIEKLFNQVTDRIPPYEYNPDLTRAENDAAAKAHYEKFGDPNKDYLDGLDQIRAQSWDAPPGILPGLPHG